MNLQENINRIKEVMGVIQETARIAPETLMKNRIEKEVSDLKNNSKDILDNANKIIDPYIIIDKLKNYLIQNIPRATSEMKKGIGGSRFAYDAYIFIKNLIIEELKNINILKKTAIKTLGGGKEKIRKKMMDVPIDDVGTYFVDFDFLLGYDFAVDDMQEMKPYENQIDKWGKDKSNWIMDNEEKIRQDIVNTIVNNL